MSNFSRIAGFVSTRCVLLMAVLAIGLTGCGSCGDPYEDPGADVGPDVEQPTSDAGADTSSGPDDAAVPRDTNVEQGGDDVFVFDFGHTDAETDTGPIVLRLDAVIPPRGPVDGGTPIVIQGSGFTPESVVYFGGNRVELELVGDTLVGEAPAGAATGPVNVKILDPTYGEDVLIGGYEYTTTLAIDSVTPERVPSEGGVEVTIRGRGFDEDTRVSFGGTTGVRHDLVDETLMRVVVPEHAPGTFAVRATNRDATFELSNAITYFEALRLEQVRPAGGDVAGGTSVTLTGAGFEAGMMVEFGGAAATLQSVDATGTEAVVTTPAHAAGLVDVRLENPGGDAFLLRDAFYYANAGEFAVAAVHPPVGPAVGGSEVTLIGAGLDAAGLSVTFGGSAATIIEQGAGHAVVQTPMHAVGPVDVTVFDGTQSDTLIHGFTYVEDLWIDRIMPNVSDVSGGVAVTIEGEGFTGTSEVRFGSIPAAFTVDSDTQITATAPAHSAGVVDVVVARDGIEATFVDGFTYTEPLEVYGFFPVRGSMAGNTYMEIRGRGFVGNLDVTFDGVPGVDVRVLDAQTLAVRTPPHAPGAVDVLVRKGQQEALAPVPYTYFNPGSRFGGTWGGPIQGAVNVTVYSTQGTPLENAFVMLSTNAATPYTGTTDANGMVTLSGPDVYGEQTITATYKLIIEPTPCVPRMEWTASATVQRVNAENVTIFLTLQPPGPSGPPTSPDDGCDPGTQECYCRAEAPPCDQGLACSPQGICCPPPPSNETPTATFQGYLSGLDKLAEPGPAEFQMAIVYTTQRNPWSQNPDPGDGNIVLTNGNYSLRSRIGDVALVAVGGLYNNNTQTFKPLRMGIERYLFAAEGETYQVDIDLDIPLDTVLTFKLNNMPNYPEGPTVSRVVPYLDLGFEGVFGGVDIAEGSGSLVQAEHQPALTGILSDASFFAMGGVYGENQVPQTVGIARGITDTASTIHLPGLIGIGNVTSPEPGGFPVDNLFEFDVHAPVDPDFFFVSILAPAFPRPVPLWDVFLPGNARSFRLPDFPPFTSYPAGSAPSPYPSGTYYLQMIGVQKSSSFSFENFSYSDLSLDEWDAYSVSVTTFQF